MLTRTRHESVYLFAIRQRVAVLVCKGKVVRDGSEESSDDAVERRDNINNRKYEQNTHIYIIYIIHYFE